MSVRHWVQASRPLAQANIAIPLVLGQALAFAVTGRFDVLSCVLVHLFGVLDQLFIVYANDAADADADRDNDAPTPFSGGSRVVPEGKLTPTALRRAAALMALAMLALVAYLAVDRGRTETLALWAAALGLLWAYSYPPLRLSFRGQGEWLQAVGVGAVLPLFGYTVQAGGLATFPWPVLVPTILLGYAGNVTTALPDYEADRHADKRTLAVRRGQRAARLTSIALTGLAIAAVPLVGPDLRTTTLVLVLGPAASMLAANVPGIARADARHRRRVLLFLVLNGAAAAWLQVGWAVALSAS